MKRETRHLQVSNVPASASDEKLTDHFACFGKVHKIERAADGRSAVVSFVDLRAASKAYQTSSDRPRRLSPSAEATLRVEYCEPTTSTVVAPPALSPVSPAATTSTGVGGGRRDDSRERPGSSASSSKKARDSRERDGSQTSRTSRQSLNVKLGLKRTNGETDRREKVRKRSPSSHSRSSRSTLSPSVSLSSKDGKKTTETAAVVPTETTTVETTAVEEPSASADRAPSRANTESSTSSGPVDGVIVRNLPLRSTDSSLKDGIFFTFKKHGKVSRVLVVGSGEQRYALVSFKRNVDVDKVISDTDNASFFGSRIKVSVCPASQLEQQQTSSPPTTAPTPTVDEPTTVASDPTSSSAAEETRSSRTLYVGNLESRATENALRDKLGQFGIIVHVEVKNRDTPAPFAFVQYADIASVQKAIDECDRQKLTMGRNRIKVGFGKTLPANTVWLGELPKGLDVEWLSRRMRTYGDVDEVLIDSYLRQALVTFRSADAAQEAVKQLKSSRAAIARIAVSLQVDYGSPQLQDLFIDRMYRSKQLSSKPRPSSSDRRTGDKSAKRFSDSRNGPFGSSRDIDRDSRRDRDDHSRRTQSRLPTRLRNNDRRRDDDRLRLSSNNIPSSSRHHHHHHHPHRDSATINGDRRTRRHRSPRRDADNDSALENNKTLLHAVNPSADSSNRKERSRESSTSSSRSSSSSSSEPADGRSSSNTDRSHDSKNDGAGGAKPDSGGDANGGEQPPKDGGNLSRLNEQRESILQMLSALESGRMAAPGSAASKTAIIAAQQLQALLAKMAASGGSSPIMSAKFAQLSALIGVAATSTAAVDKNVDSVTATDAHQSSGKATADSAAVKLQLKDIFDLEWQTDSKQSKPTDSNSVVEDTSVIGTTTTQGTDAKTVSDSGPLSQIARNDDLLASLKQQLLVCDDGTDTPVVDEPTSAQQPEQRGSRDSGFYDVAEEAAATVTKTSSAPPIITSVAAVDAASMALLPEAVAASLAKLVAPAGPNTAEVAKLLTATFSELATAKTPLANGKTDVPVPIATTTGGVVTSAVSTNTKPTVTTTAATDTVTTSSHPATTTTTSSSHRHHRTGPKSIPLETTDTDAVIDPRTTARHQTPVPVIDLPMPPFARTLSSPLAAAKKTSIAATVDGKRTSSGENSLVQQSLDSMASSSAEPSPQQQTTTTTTTASGGASHCRLSRSASSSSDAMLSPETTAITTPSTDIFGQSLLSPTGGTTGTGGRPGDSPNRPSLEDRIKALNSRINQVNDNLEKTKRNNSSLDVTKYLKKKTGAVSLLTTTAATDNASTTTTTDTSSKESIYKSSIFDQDIERLKSLENKFVPPPSVSSKLGENSVEDLLATLDLPTKRSSSASHKSDNRRTSVDAMLSPSGSKKRDVKAPLSINIPHHSSSHPTDPSSAGSAHTPLMSPTTGAPLHGILKKPKTPTSGSSTAHIPPLIPPPLPPPPVVLPIFPPPPNFVGLHPPNFNVPPPPVPPPMNMNWPPPPIPNLLVPPPPPPPTLPLTPGGSQATDPRMAAKKEASMKSPPASLPTTPTLFTRGGGSKASPFASATATTPTTPTSGWMSNKATPFRQGNAPVPIMNLNHSGEPIHHGERARLAPPLRSYSTSGSVKTFGLRTADNPPPPSYVHQRSADASSSSPISAAVVGRTKQQQQSQKELRNRELDELFRKQAVDSESSKRTLLPKIRKKTEPKLPTNTVVPSSSVNKSTTGGQKEKSVTEKTHKAVDKSSDKKDKEKERDKTKMKDKSKEKSTVDRAKKSVDKENIQEKHSEKKRDDAPKMSKVDTKIRDGSKKEKSADALTKKLKVAESKKTESQTDSDDDDSKGKQSASSSAHNDHRHHKSHRRRKRSGAATGDSDFSDSSDADVATKKQQQPRKEHRSGSGDGSSSSDGSTSSSDEESRAQKSFEKEIQRILEEESQFGSGLSMYDRVKRRSSAMRGTSGSSAQAEENKKQFLDKLKEQHIRKDKQKGPGRRRVKIDSSDEDDDELDKNSVDSQPPSDSDEAENDPSEMRKLSAKSATAVRKSKHLTLDEVFGCGDSSDDEGDHPPQLPPEAPTVDVQRHKEERHKEKAKDKGLSDGGAPPVKKKKSSVHTPDMSTKHRLSVEKSAQTLSKKDEIRKKSIKSEKRRASIDKQTVDGDSVPSDEKLTAKKKEQKHKDLKKEEKKNRKRHLSGTAEDHPTAVDDAATPAVSKKAKLEELNKADRRLEKERKKQARKEEKKQLRKEKTDAEKKDAKNKVDKPIKEETTEDSKDETMSFTADESVDRSSPPAAHRLVTKAAMKAVSIASSPARLVSPPSEKTLDTNEILSNDIVEALRRQIDDSTVDNSIDDGAAPLTVTECAEVEIHEGDTVLVVEGDSVRECVVASSSGDEKPTATTDETAVDAEEEENAAVLSLKAELQQSAVHSGVDTHARCGSAPRNSDESSRDSFVAATDQAAAAAAAMIIASSNDDIEQPSVSTSTVPVVTVPASDTVVPADIPTPVLTNAVPKLTSPPPVVTQQHSHVAAPTMEQTATKIGPSIEASINNGQLNQQPTGSHVDEVIDDIVRGYVEVDPEEMIKHHRKLSSVNRSPNIEDTVTAVVAANRCYQSTAATTSTFAGATTTQPLYHPPLSSGPCTVPQDPHPAVASTVAAVASGFAGGRASTPRAQLQQASLAPSVQHQPTLPYGNPTASHFPFPTASTPSTTKATANPAVSSYQQLLEQSSAAITAAKYISELAACGGGAQQRSPGSHFPTPNYAATAGFPPMDPQTRAFIELQQYQQAAWMQQQQQRQGAATVRPQQQQQQHPPTPQSNTPVSTPTGLEAELRLREQQFQTSATNGQAIGHIPATPTQQQYYPPPPVANNGTKILDRYPVRWQGNLALKNIEALVQMHFITGNQNMIQYSLNEASKNDVGENGGSTLRVNQRMRLEAQQLEGVKRRMEMLDEHCVLLALPCGHSPQDILENSQRLQGGFIDYLTSKQAAGIVNVALPDAQGQMIPSYVVHIFPECEFSYDHLVTHAQDFLTSVKARQTSYLFIVITTVQ